MTPSRYIGQRTHTTGDINFAAACMSMGVPLFQGNPVNVVFRENSGNRYGSFHLCWGTVDGKTETSDLSNKWASPPKDPVDPFVALMDFIRARPEGCSTEDDWLYHAHRWLSKRGIRPIDAPRSIEAIPDFVSRHQADLSGYIFSFPYNRRTCREEYNNAVPQFYQSRSDGGRTRHLKLALDAPKRIADELLPRING